MPAFAMQKYTAPPAVRQVPPGIMPSAPAALMPARGPQNPYGFNPQPEPPRRGVPSLNIYGFNPQPEPPRAMSVPPGIMPFRGVGAWKDMSDEQKTQAIWGAASTVSMAASVYHGYKRNNSVGWALWWGLMGAMFPVITPVIAIAQGFGKRSVGGR